MLFQFKQFSLNDDKCAMKIGTDACLLGAWADTGKAQHILDIGTGCGVIALMLAQRGKALIDAIEIDNDAYMQASENFINSQWNEKLTAVLSPIQEYIKNCSKKYDIIVSNPPYFQNSLKTPDSKRKLARHNDTLTYKELLLCSSFLLNNNGKLYIIIPSNISQTLINLGIIEGFYVNEILYIKSKLCDNQLLRVILLFGKKNKKCIEKTIAILDNSGKLYSDEYIQLMKNYYINL